MKDQALALKWIKRNIKYFGGDSSSITLTGFSAGSASVHLHYFSPTSRGLFHRGISNSGSALGSWALQNNAYGNAISLGKALDCPTNSTEILVRCLKTKSADSIVKSQTLSAPFPIVLFAPVVENNKKNAFLPEHPFKLLKEKQVYDVPWITSHTSHDGYIITLRKFIIYNH